MYNSISFLRLTLSQYGWVFDLPATLVVSLVPGIYTLTLELWIQDSSPY